VTVRILARGHPAVTGRHGKTLEITAGPEITARASCVLGTSAGPLPGGLPTLRGRVRLELAVGDRTAAVEGEANPHFASTTRLVVRRSDVLDADTFLVNASAAAADLDRALVERLRDPAARLEVTAAEVGTPPPVLLVLAAPPPAGWAGLAAQVEHVVDLGGPGVPLPGRRHRAVPTDLAGARTVAVQVPGLDALSAPVRERLAAALPGARVLTWPPAPPGVDLLLAAGTAPSPVLHGGRLPWAARAVPALAALLGAAPAATLTVDPADVPAAAAGAGRVRSPARGEPLAMLDELRGRLPDHALLVPDPAVGWGVGAAEVPPAAPLDPPRLAGLRRAPAVAFARRGDAPAPLAVDPGELARALRAAGVSGRSAAAVLTGLGVGRREAYRLAAADPCGYPDGPTQPAR
jgi:hypothetical protein